MLHGMTLLPVELRHVPRSCMPQAIPYLPETQRVSDHSEPVTLQRARLEGALDALAELHEELTLRCDEAQSEAARDAYDEVLTVVEARQAEYRRRHDALPPVTGRHASFIFLLDETGEVHPLPHTLYLALVRRVATAPEFAGKMLRVAEWYVRLKHDEPEAVVNEHYGFLAFDREGRLDRERSRPEAEEALPSRQERARIETVLFASSGEQ